MNRILQTVSQKAESSEALRKLILTTFLAMVILQTKNVLVSYLNYPTAQQIHWFVAANYVSPSITFEMASFRLQDFHELSFVQYDNFTTQHLCTITGLKKDSNETTYVNYFNKLTRPDVHVMGDAGKNQIQDNSRSSRFEFSYLFQIMGAKTLSLAIATDSPFQSQVN